MHCRCRFLKDISFLFLLTFALDSGRWSEGRPELLGAAVAARRHVVRNLQEDENSVRLSTCFDCRRCLDVVDVLIFQVLSRAFPGRVLIGQTENFTCTYPLIGDLNRFKPIHWKMMNRLSDQILPTMTRKSLGSEIG